MTSHGWLFDTHALLWLLYDDPRLSSGAVAAFESDVPLYYSVVTYWEIALKRSSSGFDFEIEDNWDELIPSALETLGLLKMEIDARDCRRSENLPLHHRDPFDRLMIAQCQVRNLGAITRDLKWRDYEISCLW